MVDAEHAWFTVPAASALIPHVWGAYWAVSLAVRLGPGRKAFESFAVVMALGGTFNVLLQTAQGVSGFTLPAPPLIAAMCVCASMYLLIPLFIPAMLRPGLDRLPPEAQVRGGWLAPSVALSGTAALLAATATVAGERPWAVPFALGVVTLLLVLAGLRQVAGAKETKRLYRQVEEASDERRQLLTQMLERSLHDRRRFAGQLHDQAVSAYASFSALAGPGPRPAPGLAGVVAKASEVMRGDLARHADSLQELLLAMSPLEGAPAPGRPGEGLRTPIAAFLAGAYGDRRPPRLTVEVAEPLHLDWVTETVLLQVVQDALHNVWRHSQARAVAVSVARDGDAVVVHVADDGVGFDPATVEQESGLAAMRASATVLGGPWPSRRGRGRGRWSAPGWGRDPGASRPPGTRHWACRSRRRRRCRAQPACAWSPGPGSTPGATPGLPAAELRGGRAAVVVAGAAAGAVGSGVRSWVMRMPSSTMSSIRSSRVGRSSGGWSTQSVISSWTAPNRPTARLRWRCGDTRRLSKWTCMKACSQAGNTPSISRRSASCAGSIPTVSMNATRATRGSSSSVWTSALTRPRSEASGPVAPIAVHEAKAPATMRSPTATSSASRLSNSS